MRNVTLGLTMSHVIGTTVNVDFKGSQFANRVSPGRVRLFKFTPQLRFSAKGYEFHTYLALSLWFLNFVSAPFFLHDCLQCFRETLRTEVMLYSSIQVLDSVIHAKMPLSK